MNWSMICIPYWRLCSQKSPLISFKFNHISSQLTSAVIQSAGQTVATIEANKKRKSKHPVLTILQCFHWTSCMFFLSWIDCFLFPSLVFLSSFSASLSLNHSACNVCWSSLVGFVSVCVSCCVLTWLLVPCAHPSCVAIPCVTKVLWPQPVS